MTPPSAAVTVGNVETTATTVTDSVPPPTAAATVSPTLRLFAARNARVATPGMTAVRRAGTARSSSPRTGVVSDCELDSAAVPCPGSNVVVHAASAPSWDDMTRGNIESLATSKDWLRAANSGDEAVAIQPDTGLPVAEFTDTSRNAAGTGARVSGIS